MGTHDNTPLNYAIDNTLGEITEYFILQIYLNKGYDESIKRDEYVKTHDLEIPQLDYLVEVKYDYKSRKTTNLFFEHIYRDKPSGFKTSLAEFWYMSNGEYVWMFPLEQIKTWFDLGIYENKSIRGKSNGATGMIIPETIYEPHAIAKIKIPKKSNAYYKNLEILKEGMKENGDVDVIRGFRRQYRLDFLEKNIDKIKKPEIIKNN